MRKSYLLKYITIGSIIAGMVRLIFGFMMINFFTASITYEVVSPETLRTAIWAIIFVMLNVIAQLVSGFVGAANWEEPERAPVCFICGVVSLVLGVVANLLQIRCGYGASLYTWILGVGVPALYTVAALNFWIGVRISKKRSARQS